MDEDRNKPETNGQINTLEQILLASAEEFGVEVEVVDLGIPIEPYKGLTELEELAKIIKDYIEGPTIIYKQKTSYLVKRAFSAYVRNVDPPTHNWFESNRLRFNHMNGIGKLPIIFEKQLEFFPGIKTSLQKITQNIPDGADLFEKKDMDKQINITEKLASDLQELWNLIQHAQPRRSSS